MILQTLRCHPRPDWTGHGIVFCLLGLILLLVATGACDRHQTPDGRLKQKAGRFSIAIPEGWQVSQPVGLPFAILSGPADAGLRPNLFTDGTPEAASLATGARDQIEAYQAAHPDHAASAPLPFATAEGLPGMKTRATRRTREELSLVLFHYTIQDDSRVIQMTGSCAEPAAARYEPLFDAAVRSLRIEPRQDRTPHPPPRSPP
jgi:hypothetical protein